MIRLQSGLFSVLLLGLAGSPATADEVWSLDGLKAPESVLFDAKRNVFYVSNIVGEPNGKDGVGYLSKVSPDGKLQAAEWVTGFDAPKGLVMKGDTLFITDIDRLMAVDVESGQIREWAAEGAELLNDPAVDEAGRVFASDMLASRTTSCIMKSLSVWLESEAAPAPERLARSRRSPLAAGWGRTSSRILASKTPGHLITIDLKTKAISNIGSGDPVGNLDGLEADGAGNWLVTDWIAGGLLRIHPDGKAEQLMDLNQGSADIEFIEEKKLVIIPMMMDGKLVATELD